MRTIEIPQPKERGFKYRFFEALPGLLSWSMLILPIVLSWWNPTVMAFFVIFYILIWFAKAVGLNIRVLQGWNVMQRHMKLDWTKLLEDLKDPAAALEGSKAGKPEWHLRNLERVARRGIFMDPDDVIHAVIIATYNEQRETLEPTIQAVANSHYDPKKVIFILAYEERGGERVDRQAQELTKAYEKTFMWSVAVKHPKDMPGEVIGKGGNITYAGYWLQEQLEKQGIDPRRVMVTTLDADNIPHAKYLPSLTYTYLVAEDPIHKSYQPIPLYTNNIWDAPAPMRVIAAGNSYWYLVLSMRPHLARNFSAHAQPMAALIETDFWSVRTIVEDGHQFWRSYFRFDGNHEVIPLYAPIYQDAVLADGYIRTLKQQFIQLRRWAWGASDVAYVVYMGYMHKNKVPKFDLLTKFLRLLEGHISWATSSLILLLSPLVPLYVNSDAHRSFIANQLPLIGSRIQTLAMLGILGTIYISLKALPPKPARYRRHRSLFMLLQWVYMPVTSIMYGSFAAINSQTRLIFGRYLDKFDVTEKAVKK